MTTDRWNQIKAILDEADGCDPASRDRLLRQRFGADDDLRRDIETLLTLPADESTREISATQASLSPR